MNLTDFFSKYPKVALGFSGGVDSSYLAYAAKQSGANLLAIYYHSEFQPEFELDDAKRFCQMYHIPLKIIEGSILTEHSVISNPTDRCYYCKKRIFGEISNFALQSGFSVLLDGTNASDEASDRPGMKALTELSVLSPLRICGLTKEEIRRLSKEAGLFTWNKPAYACLATRIPTGQKITDDLLKSVEHCEMLLFQMGFHDFRVRIRDYGGLLQVTAEEYSLAEQKIEEIRRAFSPYFSQVLLDTTTR